MAFSDLTLYYKVAYTDSWTSLDTSLYVIKELTRSYSHPSTLTFDYIGAQHSLPIPYNAFILFVDTSTHTTGSPTFEGSVFEIKPAESNLVSYTCYSQDFQAGRDCFIMSGPSSASYSLPRLVFNCKIDTDRDYAYSRDNDATVQTIVQDILDDSAPELRSLLAAPTGTVAPYTTGDMSSWDFKPQEKITFQNQTLAGGLQQMTHFYPQYRMLFSMGSDNRKWRFVDLLAAGQQTFTLNAYSGTYKVLSFQLNRSLESRYTAIQFYGPEQSTVAYFKTSDSTLDEGWSSGEGTFEANGPTSTPNDVGRKWQVHDSTKRRLSEMLPVETAIPILYAGATPTAWMYVKYPKLLASWDSGVTFQPYDCTLDHNLGIAISNVPIYRYEPHDHSSAPYRLPDTVILVAAYLSAPLTLRVPSSGYAGTAYSVGGLSNTERIYDELLAVGYNFSGAAVSSVTRLAEFTKLATARHYANRDIVFAGGCVLQGLQYDFHGLNKRINFTSLDKTDPTTTITTGFESIDAFLTDVNFNYLDQITTLTLNSDHLEYTNSDPEMLKKILKIKALQTVDISHFNIDVKGRDIIYNIGKDRHFIDTDTGLEG